MPPSTQGVSSAVSSASGWASDTGPRRFIPTASAVSPKAEASVTTPRTRYLRSVKVCTGVTRSGAGVDGRARGIGGLDLTVGQYLVACGTKLEERLSLNIKPLHVTINNGLADDPPRCLGTEVVLVVEAVHHLKHVVFGQARIFDVRELMSAFIDHGSVVDDETILRGIVIELGAGIGVGDRNLDGLDVKSLGEVDGVADRFLGFAREAEDEIAMDGEAKLMTIASEVAGPFHGRAFFNVLENLRIAGFKAHNQQPASRFTHGLEGFAICGYTGGAGPGELQRFQFRAKLHCARFLDVE